MTGVFSRSVIAATCCRRLPLTGTRTFISDVSSTSIPPRINKSLATLRVHGTDRKGIVATCSNLLDRHGYEIVRSEHWSDRKDHMFYLRMAFDTTRDSSISQLQEAQQRQAAQAELEQACHEWQLHLDLNWRLQRRKVAIMVSKYDHCLWELLLRHGAHELDCDITVVLSNHDKLRSVADTFGIPYHVFPITPENKLEQEQKQLNLLQQADVIVLARYMQVLSDSFLSVFPNRIINIHHSFLPAFSGGRPYYGAFERGVKLIGATAHYVTEELDEGPIIEQDVIEVSHRDEMGGLMRKGRILERNVLVRALQAHLEDRVIVHKNKCVVFGD